MEIAFDALAMSALDGASGQLGQSAVAVLWERLRDRFANDEDVVTALDTRDSDDSGAVVRVSEALRQLAENDAGFRAELVEFTRQQGFSTSTVNTVHDSQGLNAPGGTFTAPITMNFDSDVDRPAR